MESRIKAVRGGKVLYITEEEIEYMVAKGYSVTLADGSIKKKPDLSDIKTLTKEVERLTKENTTLKAQNTKLKNKLKGD